MCICDRRCIRRQAPKPLSDIWILLAKRLSPPQPAHVQHNSPPTHHCPAARWVMSDQPNPAYHVQHMLRLIQIRALPLVLFAIQLLVPARSFGESNFWVRHEAGDRGVIVFVHGILGDATKTWRSGNAYWPEMLTRDHTFDGQDIYAYEYPTSKLDRTLSISEVAEHMRLILTADGVLDHSEITFVAHSMGGIVTRDFILKNREIVAPKIRLLYFFATPTYGAAASVIGSLVGSNPQFDDLGLTTSSDNYLVELATNWQAAKLRIRSYCAYEVRQTYGVLVVDVASATALCTEPYMAIDSDHTNIVKPRDARSPSYLALKDAFRETRPVDLPTGHRRGEATHIALKPAIERTSEFTVMVPFDTDEAASLIPYDENPDDPLYTTYVKLASLASSATIPDELRRSNANQDRSLMRPTRPTINDAPEFLCKLLQYFIFHRISEMQRDRIAVYGNAYPMEAKAGVQPPDAEIYPSARLHDDLAGNRFFKPFDYLTIGDELDWQVRPGKMPRGTKILFYSPSPGRQSIRLEKQEYFEVDFTVRPLAGTAVGQLPKNFYSVKASTVMQFAFITTMHYAISHSSDASFNSQTYTHWFDSLFDGLRTSLEVDQSHSRLQ